MHGLGACTLHNSEGVEPLTWTRVQPTHCCERTVMQALSCYALSSFNISKYTSFKPIICVVILSIDQLHKGSHLSCWCNVEDIANAQLKIKPSKRVDEFVFINFKRKKKREKVIQIPSRISNYIFMFFYIFTSLHHYVLLFLQLQMIIQNTYSSVSQSMNCLT